MPEFYTHIAVPIEQPFDYLAGCHSVPFEPFMFDQISRFKKFVPKKPGANIQLVADDRGNWFLLTYFKRDSLTDLKWARQLARPAYLEEDTRLPLIDLISSENLKINWSGFDKAFAHTSVLVDKLEAFPAELQARLANNDGEDDPRVVDNIHFITNIYNGLRTRYISGAETLSFATVTENKFYFQQLHLQNTAFLYLLYFVYFMEYEELPSKQMVPRLLGNLWASKQMFKNNWNNTLIGVENIE